MTTDNQPPQPSSGPVFLTVADLCRELKIGRTLAYRLMNNGTIPYRQFGSTRRIPAAWVQAQADTMFDTTPSEYG